MLEAGMLLETGQPPEILHLARCFDRPYTHNQYVMQTHEETVVAQRYSPVRILRLAIQRSPQNIPAYKFVSFELSWSLQLEDPPIFELQALIGYRLPE